MSVQHGGYIMAFLDHIDPGNSGGSVPTPATPFLKPLEPIIYSCDQCTRLFKNRVQLSEHQMSAHPITRPLLLINGLPPKSVQFLDKKHINIRSIISPESICFQDVDAIYIDKIIEPSRKKIIKQLCSKSRSSFELKITNGNYAYYYQWTIDIASASELDKIDDTFYSVFKTGQGVVQAFALFNEQVSSASSAAKKYAAGLSCYVTAIITKDQLPGATLKYDKYGQKLGESIDKLEHFRGRTLADAVLSIGQFMQNDFNFLSADQRLPGLDNAKRFFTNGKFLSSKTTKKPLQPIPIDLVTELLIEFSSGSNTFQQDYIISIEGCMTMADDRDRAKLAFSAWAYANNTGQLDKAHELTSSLKHDPYFSILVEKLRGI